MFDPNDFLTSTNETVLDDKYNLLPDGEYEAQVSMEDNAVVITTGESTNKKGEPKLWAQVAYRFEILDPTGAIEKELKRKPAITDRFFLDLDEVGKLDQAPQRNVRMGALLKATNKARPGWKFTDPKGQRLKIKIAQVKSDMNPGEKRNQVMHYGASAG